ncbi:MAG TPA: adenylate/guanylate cyclase domain-containing protein [Methyloceanibacter sp.]|nr:adenylate/guanylate cyclase domain-containing protein [Methyloceanibacter sp.]
MNDSSPAATDTDIVTSIITSGMADVPVAALVEGAMLRLVGAGVPLHRMQVGFRILHPLFDGMSIIWTEEAGVEVEYFAAIDQDGSVFRLSPFYYMLSNELTEFRLRLDRDATVDRFPLLAQFRGRGLTDYLAMIVAFGDAPMTPETHNGLGISWATREREGFSSAHVATMRQVLAPLALALRVVIKDQITKNALNTFHGPLIGERILSGTIKRGAGERLSAALWYSDLRNSTGLADALSVDRFLDLLNTYFDCAAGAVTAQGGQVLDIIGDAILAFFPATEAGGEAEACARALEAALDAQARLVTLQQDGGEQARAIAFRVGVHFGDVVFGNAGTAERLKFGVIGRAVNEVARTVDAAKALGRPIVVSEEAASRVRRPFTDLGLHDLRGIPAPRRLWALEVPAAQTA